MEQPTGKKKLKQMVLISPEFLAKLCGKSENLKKVNKENIDRILKQKISPEDKLARYKEALNSYQKSIDESLQPIEVPIFESVVKKKKKVSRGKRRPPRVIYEDSTEHEELNDSQEELLDQPSFARRQFSNKSSPLPRFRPRNRLRPRQVWANLK